MGLSGFLVGGQGPRINRHGLLPVTATMTNNPGAPAPTEMMAAETHWNPVRVAENGSMGTAGIGDSHLLYSTLCMR